MEARGKNFLRVTGIIMVVFGVLGVISAAISFSDLKSLIATYEALAMNTSLLVPNLIVGVIAAVYEVVVGVLGILLCKKPDKATANIAAGAFLCVIEIATGILSLWIVNAEGSGITSGIISMIISLILPVLYVYGGILNKQS